jgi:hypothetical protein
MSAPWSPETARACGIDWLLREIAPAGGLGRSARKRERAFAPGDEADAAAMLARVDALARSAGSSRLGTLRAAIAAVPDPSAALTRARGGDVLGDVDFFELARFLDALGTVASETRGDAFAAIEIPEPNAALAEALAPGRADGRSFYIADGFDRGLAAARGESAASRAAFDSARSRLVARARETGIGDVRDGEFVVMRDTAPMPLPPEIRVLREAPTYYLCELALDAAALDALAALENADAAVAEAEEDVRRRLSRATADAAPELERSCSLLGDLDVLVARAAFAARNDCVVPELSTNEHLELRDARFPPLDEALSSRGRTYVPISLALDGVAVVTGPNMGGKTVALRTLGFAAACVTLGVPVPAAFARIPLVDEIAWLGIGAAVPDAEDAPLLSAFGSEVVSLRAFLERPARRALVLADEFARTTSPSEGRALLVALLEALRVRGALGLAATHLAGVAARADVTHFAIGRLRELPPADDPLPLARALERIAAAMDYALVRVDETDPGESGAIALAGALGLDAALVARAAEVLRSPEKREP